MKDMNNLNNDEKIFIFRSMLIGAIQATVVPLLIMMIINISFDGNYGGIVGIVYIAIIARYYTKSTNKYFSQKGFNFALIAILGLFVFIGILGILFSAF